MRKQKEYLNNLIAIISKPGKQTVEIEAWKHHSIMEALHWFGIERLEAYDAAKRCGRTHEELSFKIGKEKDVTIKLKSEGREKDGKNLPDAGGRVSD